MRKHPKIGRQVITPTVSFFFDYHVTFCLHFVMSSITPHNEHQQQQLLLGVGGGRRVMKKYFLPANGT
jgi:hypothetical protein